MAKQVLPTNFVDDILAPSMGRKRKYRIIDNGDDTYSFEDVTEYTQTGSDFGAGQINATNQAVNESCDKSDVIDDRDDIVANQANGKIAGAKAVAELINDINTLSFESAQEITSDYLSAPFVFRRIGKVVMVTLASAKQSHSWGAGTTQLYTTTPTAFAPEETIRIPFFRNQSCIGYISIAPTSGIYVNSASAINDGSATFSCMGTYLVP